MFSFVSVAAPNRNSSRGRQSTRVQQISRPQMNIQRVRTQQNVQRVRAQQNFQKTRVQESRKVNVAKATQRSKSQFMRPQQNRPQTISKNSQRVKVITPNKNRKPISVRVDRPRKITKHFHRPSRTYFSYRPTRVRPFISTWVFVPRQEIVYVAPTTTTTTIVATTEQTEVEIFTSNLAKDISSELNKKNVSSQYKMYIDVESYSSSSSGYSAKVNVVFERESDGAEINVQASGSQFSVDKLSQEIAIKVANAVSL